jgi:glycine/D-amino acid oxidase-like deaminating enzyme
MQETSWWALPRFRRRPPLRKEFSADVAIVGGGLTGVWAAYHCAKRGFKTVLVEKDHLAAGASGKNEGMLVEGLPLDFLQLVRSLGWKAAKEVWGNTSRAQEHVLKAVRKHRIACDIEQTGSLYATRDEEGWLRKEAAMRRKAGFACRMVNDLGAFVNSSFASALHAPHDCLMHPVKLLQGIADAAEAAGARIYERSPAQWSRSIVRTPRGGITAAHVLVALESYNPLLPSVNAHRRRGVALVTKPLPPEALRRLGWTRGKMLWETGHTYHSTRMLGNRLMTAVNIPLAGTRTHIANATKHLLKNLRSFFPALRPQDIAASHRWHCATVNTPRRLLTFMNADGVHHAIGLAGNGQTHGYIAGSAFADHITGRDIPAVYRTTGPVAKPDITW